MTLKPQDVLVLLKLLAMGQHPWTYASLAVNLGMSPSQLHAAVKRSLAAKLAMRKEGSIVPNTRNLNEFVIHGLKFVFVPDRGELTRGIPTAHAAPPLARSFVQSDEPPPVWPHANGNIRGAAFSPIYHLAPDAALSDVDLYELLVLIDAIRGGRARERDYAAREFKERVRSYG